MEDNWTRYTWQGEGPQVLTVFSHHLEEDIYTDGDKWNMTRCLFLPL